jgi:hypothetical protein
MIIINNHLNYFREKDKKDRRYLDNARALCIILKVTTKGYSICINAILKY